MTHVRLEWNIDGRMGHGPWLQIQHHLTTMMEEWVQALNKRCGTGTHWLEYK